MRSTDVFTLRCVQYCLHEASSRLEYVAACVRKVKVMYELFEKFSHVDVERRHVRVAVLRLQRHLLNDFVNQLPVLNALLLAPVCQRPATN